MSEWQECKLGEFVDVINGFAFKSANFLVDTTADTLPVIKIKNVANGDANLDGVQHHHYSENLSKYIVEKNDVLVALTGNHPQAETQVVGLTSRYKLNSKALLNQRVAKIISKDEKTLSSDFIYYFLKDSNTHLYLAGQSSGSANQANISKSDIENIPFCLPSKDEQRTIANILSSLDDKIDLLHRQNKTLEAMAETLFRQWFIEEASDDWEELPLEALVESANTGLDAIKRAPIVEYDTGIKCLRIQDISQNKKFDNWGNSKVLEKDFEKAQLKTDDLIMARTCSPGIIYLVRENLNAVFNNGLARIRPNKNKTYSIFLFYLFKTEEFIGHIYGISDGTSVQLNMKLGDLLSYKVAFPPKELQDKYYPHFKAIEHKVFKNQIQINTLEKLRDNLLPKLMSGEVRVKL
jgi:type I restriction enzyme S subunit